MISAIILGLVAAKPTKISIVPYGVLPWAKAIAFAPAPTGSKVLVATEDWNVRIIDAATKHTVNVMTTHLQPAFALAWSPNGKWVASGDETARIYIENPNSPRPHVLKQYRTHTKGIQKLSFDATSRYLLSTGKDDRVNVYDLLSPKPKEIEHIFGKGANFYGGEFDPTRPGVFAVGTLTGPTRLYVARTGREIESFTNSGGDGVFDVDFSPNGKTLYSADRDGDTPVFDVAQDRRLGRLQGHSDWTECLAVSPNGALVASSSADGTIIVWNTFTYQRVAVLENISRTFAPLCFTGDGRFLLAVNADGSTKIYKVVPPQGSGKVLTRRPAVRRMVHRFIRKKRVIRKKARKGRRPPAIPRH